MVEVHQDKTLQLQAKIEPNTASQDVTWSINPKGSAVAEVSDKGLVTVTIDATVGAVYTITATSTVNPDIRATVKIKVIAHYVYIPDPEFRHYLKARFKKAFLGEALNPDDPSIKRAKKIDVSGKGIKSLDGIECFTHLKTLKCSDNKLTYLDVSSNTALKHLGCHKNQLTYLDVSQNKALTYLSCSHNELSRLDISQNKQLKQLWCIGNELTQLDVSKNTALQVLGCNDNGLTRLDLSQNKQLKQLQCQQNKLKYLDITGFRVNYGPSERWKFEIYYGHNPKERYLQTLKVNEAVKDHYEINQVKTLSPKAIVQVYSNDGDETCPSYVFTADYDTDKTATGLCENSLVTIQDDEFRAYLQKRFPTAFYKGEMNSDNPDIKKAIAIDVSGKGIESLEGIAYFTALQSLNCSDNQLTTLDVRSNTALDTLDCHQNQLTTLDVRSNTALDKLDCHQNQLTYLDVSQNKALTYLSCSHNELSRLDISQNKQLKQLWCIGNELTQLDVSKNTALQVLGCNDNRLTRLDLSQNKQLKLLWCYQNKLTYLDATGFRYKFDDTDERYRFEVYYNEHIQEGKLKNLKINDFLKDYKEIKEIKSQTPKTTAIAVYDDEGQIRCSNYSFKTIKDKGYYLDMAPHGTCLSALVDIPDQTLRHRLKSDFFSKDDSAFWDTKLDSTNERARSVKELKYMDGILEKISSFKGIAAFTELETLNCSNHKLVNLDVSQNKKLKKLVCSNCDLKNLNISQNKALLLLRCDGNALRQLDVSANENLVSLCCSNNQLSNLHLKGNTHLVQLWCYDNPLKALNMTGLHKGSKADIKKWTEMTLLPADCLENEKYRRLRIYTCSEKGDISETKTLHTLKIDKQFKNHYEVKTIRKYSPYCKIHFFPQ